MSRFRVECCSQTVAEFPVVVFEDRLRVILWRHSTAVIDGHRGLSRKTRSSVLIPLEDQGRVHRTLNLPPCPTCKRPLTARVDKFAVVADTLLESGRNSEEASVIERMLGLV